MLQEIGTRLIDRGYKVIPIKKGKKFPCIDEWQKANATHEDLARWSKEFPESGIGVLCKNTIAVDVDCYHLACCNTDRGVSGPGLDKLWG